MIVLWLILTFTPASVAFQWTSSATAPANGSTVPACSGQDVTLAWDYSTSPAEHLVNVEWRRTPASGGNEVVLATVVMGSFVPASGVPVHVQYIPSAGIRLKNVTVADAGTYSVHVNVNLHGSVITEVQTVTVAVSDATLTTDGQLHIKTLPGAVYDNSTQEFYIQLACGTFHSVGEPKAVVVWKTPSLQSLPSTSFNNGFFTLSVPNPVVSGEYSCLIDDNSAASVCIQSGSPLRGGATISVDGKEARFNLTEARYQQEIAALQQKIIDIENKHQQELAALKQENADKINELKANITALSQVPCDVLSYERGLPSGVYMVPIGTSRVSVYCDQDTDNGGWTVIQRRLDGSVDFYRYWRDYEDGFGNTSGEYWLGLRNIYTMTSHRNYRLRVDLEDFGGNTAYADYNHFSISGPSDNYRLSISGFNGTTGSSTPGLEYSNDVGFSTRDKDHDIHNSANCAVEYRHGGWWYTACGYTNLNGVYKGAGESGYDAVFWEAWRQLKALKRVEMKIRPA